MGEDYTALSGMLETERLRGNEVGHVSEGLKRAMGAQEQSCQLLEVRVQGFLDTVEKDKFFYKQEVQEQVLDLERDLGRVQAQAETATRQAIADRDDAMRALEMARKELLCVERHARDMELQHVAEQEALRQERGHMEEVVHAEKTFSHRVAKDAPAEMSVLKNEMAELVVNLDRVTGQKLALEDELAKSRGMNKVCQLTTEPLL